MKKLNEDFENALAEFTGASGVIATDSCTHAIELALSYSKPKMYATIPAQTYFSIPIILEKLGIDFMFTDVEWENEYRIEGSVVYDSAKHFAKDMFQTDNPNQRKIVCLSFGPGSPLEIGNGGAILTNDKEAYEWLHSVVGTGRDLSIANWEDQTEFTVGYGYQMRSEDAAIGLKKLQNNEIIDLGENGYNKYPDLRNIKITRTPKLLEH